MSEEETTTQIQDISTPIDVNQSDEAVKPSEKISEDDPIAKTESLDRDPSPSLQLVDNETKNLETRTENSAFTSSPGITEIPARNAESITSEKVLEEPVLSSDPNDSRTSSDNTNSSKNKDAESPPCDTGSIKVPRKELQSIKADSKPTPKIKVLINSTNKLMEPEKVAEEKKRSAERSEIEAPKLDANCKEESQQEIKSSSPDDTHNTQSSEQYAENVTYTEDGTAIYVDPKTQHKYKWSLEKNDWIAFDEQDSNPSAIATATASDNENNKNSNPYENEHYRWCSESNQWIPKNTQQMSSLTETEHYRWDAQKNEWIMKTQVPSLDDVTYGYEDGVRIYTDKDGMVFFWDDEKKAWFPKIDDDFLAKYQMSYGFIDNTSAPAIANATAPGSATDAGATGAAEEEDNKIDLEKKAEQLKKNDAAAGGVKRKAPPEPPKWFEVDATQNTKVYVSNLPLDITMEEFSEIMSKCGMIMKDPQTQKQKLKLYAEPDGQLKGDGLCDYIKVESVDLALKLLDESIVRGNKIKVQRAKFQMRGEYNPSLKPKRKKKDKEKLIKMKEKLFDWRPEKMRGERSKHERTVIIKNLFTPELFDKEVQLIIEYQNDLREECSKCGTVRKVVIYDRHAEGVAQVNMADPEQADLVIQMMNGRFFGQRKLTAETWDGKTKYKVAETEEEIQARINKWDKYLEKGEANEKDDDDDDETEDDESANESTKIKTDEKEKVAPVATA
ncbi:uncharacterized protein LOC129947559 isoform X2 [Eupeodes corollae]|nr:uncharacterized protein LOC129947559 isoform X2 [Eupeodes corollae]XP_055914139.1 uncharacterized protein LOC129947559 isoform X2 [Eupeodes corollae]XP_055914141.1 uncharacterized protein LOC129947559 isoform X2 [Eupeodes corollae]XP_055914142.1 uncharacterized protein LOC129947559 isoform X2 [Eupeodes corollae]